MAVAPSVNRYRVNMLDGRVFYVYGATWSQVWHKLAAAGLEGCTAVQAGRWVGNQIVDDPEGKPVFEGRDAP